MNTYQYSCNNCNYFIETSGPWPFYRTRTKKVRYENYIGNISGPIHGLLADIYCPTCDKQKTYTIVEYKKPLSGLDGIWLSDIQRKTKTLCHKCKNPIFWILQ